MIWLLVWVLALGLGGWAADRWPEALERLADRLFR